MVVSKVSLVCLTSGCPSLLLADTASANTYCMCNVGVVGGAHVPIAPLVLTPIICVENIQVCT